MNFYFFYPALRATAICSAPGPAHLKAMDPTMQQAMMDQAVSQVLSNVERAVDDELERVENITARRRHHPRSLFRAPG